MQVSGVSDFFRSAFDCVLLLCSCLWLLDQLSNQLVDSCVRGVYTNKICHATIRTQCDA